MIGDQADLARRLRSVLPARWFGVHTPVLNTLLDAVSAGWTFMYDLLQYTEKQTRIATASDIWLDLVAQDIFGSRLLRHTGQSDEAFRVVVRRNILRPLGTRTSLISALTDLTGRQPHVFEPHNTLDTGGYGCLGGALGGGIGYRVGGGWGNLTLPFQCFVTAFRPLINGVANLSGWSQPAGGYGVGALEYVGIDTANGHIGDADIFDEVARVVPVATVMWTRISS